MTATVDASESPSDLFAAPVRAAAGATRLWRALALADVVPAADAPAVQAYMRTGLHDVECGRWPGIAPSEGAVAHVVVEGYLVCCQKLGSGCAGHVVGPGDVLRPLEVHAAGGVSESIFEWTAVAPVTLATVDRRFTCAATKYPALLDRLFEAMELRTRRVAELHAISAMRKVDDRVMSLMWQLADAWGRVSHDGIVVSIPLTHALVAKLVAAQRPSVTTAISRLSAAGTLQRDGGAWVLDPASAPANQFA